MTSPADQFDLFPLGTDSPHGWVDIQNLPKDADLPMAPAEQPKLVMLDTASPVVPAYLKQLLPGLVMPAGVYLESAHLAAIAKLEQEFLYGDTEDQKKVLVLDSIAHLHDKGAFLADLKESLAALAKSVAEWMPSSADPEEKYVAPAKQVQTQPKRCFIRSDRPFDPATDKVHHYEQVGHVVYEVWHKPNGTRRRTPPDTAMKMEWWVKWGDMLEYTP